jgi:hypothetical protein
MEDKKQLAIRDKVTWNNVDVYLARVPVFGYQNTVELVYNVVKQTEYFVSL